MIVRIVKMEFNAEFIEEFKSLFKSVNEKIANFEGCVGVKLLQHETASTIFFTISNWETAAHLEDYRNSALFKTTWANVKPNFIAKAEAWSLLEQ